MRSAGDSCCARSTPLITTTALGARWHAATLDAAANGGQHQAAANAALLAQPPETSGGSSQPHSHTRQPLGSRQDHHRRLHHPPLHRPAWASPIAALNPSPHHIHHHYSSIAAGPLALATAPHSSALRSATRMLLQQVRARVSSTSGRDPSGSGDSSRFSLSMNGPADIESLEASMGPSSDPPGSNGGSSDPKQASSPQPGGAGAAAAQKQIQSGGGVAAGDGGNATKGNTSSSDEDSSSGSGRRACDSAELSAATLLRCMNAARQDPLGALDLPCKRPPAAGASGSGGGAPALKSEERLGAAAKKHSEYLAGSGVRAPSNSGANGSAPKQRMAAEGFAGRQVAEAVASGQARVRDVVAQWLCSSDERPHVMVRGHGRCMPTSQWLYGRDMK
jgi:hypothetical protein